MINKAKWITAGAGVCAPCIERKFYLDSKNKAELEITGLGYFICKINGKPVSDDRFMPVVSDYKERTFSDLLYPCNDKNFVHRVYYLKFDISPLISVGENTIEIFLGNGWFIQKQRTVEGDFSFSDALIAKYAIKYNDVNGVDKIILSDGCERWKNTEVVSNNIFYGERQDARILDLEAEYKSVEIYPEFETKLTVQDCPNERLIKTLTPRVVCSSGGKTIFDVGENVSGYAKIMATGKYGDVIKVVYSGNIYTDGRLNTGTTGAWMKNDNGEYQLQQDQFILDGKKREYAPKFCRHCFRYFEVDGMIDSVVVEVIYTDLAVTANFQSSSDTLNWIYDAYIRTQLNNMHDGFPSDCPHRERLGYTGDGQITAPAAMLTIDTEKFYRKWIRDVADGQNQENGHVQYTAPYFGGAGGPGGWGGAIVFVPYAFYKRFNDLDLIKQYFPNMKLWVKYMEDHTENGIVVNAEDGGYCLGDWGFPEKRQLFGILF